MLLTMEERQRRLEVAEDSQFSGDNVKSAPFARVPLYLWEMFAHVPSLWFMMAEWSAEVGQLSEAFFHR